jgi:GDPmannose 4,6-dehydratase
VTIDERYYRPAEVDLLVGDAQKARATLGWEPKYTFQDLIKEMVDSDLQACTKQLSLAKSVAET